MSDREDYYIRSKNRYINCKITMDSDKLKELGKVRKELGKRFDIPSITRNQVVQHIVAEYLNQRKAVQNDQYQQ